MPRKRRKPERSNPVAKFAAQFNRATVFRDRSKYRRKAKHRGVESFSLQIVSGLVWKRRNPACCPRAALEHRTDKSEAPNM